MDPGTSSNEPVVPVTEADIRFAPARFGLTGENDAIKGLQKKKSTIPPNAKHNHGHEERPCDGMRTTSCFWEGAAETMKGIVSS